MTGNQNERRERVNGNADARLKDPFSCFGLKALGTLEGDAAFFFGLGCQIVRLIDVKRYLKVYIWEESDKIKESVLFKKFMKALSRKVPE